MVITSGSGLVLDSYVEKFRGFGLLATVITGESGASERERVRSTMKRSFMRLRTIADVV